MRNFKIILQYEGTRYQGWQRQESTQNTIQGKLEAVLEKMCGSKVEVQGAGRTDAGVHAYGQAAHFHIDTEQSADKIMTYLNTYLPEDIAVIHIKEMPERFHSRLHARGKIYRYRVLNSEIPHIFDRRYVYPLAKQLDLEAMKQAAVLLTGKHDFKSFTSAKKGKKSTVRTIEDIRIERVGEEVRLTYTGDGFLYHMARILTGTLLEVGLGERRADSMPQLLAAKDRAQAGFLAPAAGLALLEVRYDTAVV